jgi:hypothetical protein
MFTTLHGAFMEQYTELWNALDSIAERIRCVNWQISIHLRIFCEHENDYNINRIAVRCLSSRRASGRNSRSNCRDLTCLRC